MKQISTLIALCCLANMAFSQIPTSEFFYGSPSKYDDFTDVETTPDGGYIAVGVSHTPGKGGEFFVAKFSANGEAEFLNKYGGDGNEQAYAVAVADDKYVIGGSVVEVGESARDAFLITIDLAGNLLQETTFGGAGEDFIRAVTVLDNGQIAVAAAYEGADANGADFNVRLFDESLNFLAENSFGTESADLPYFIKESSPGGNIIVGGNEDDISVDHAVIVGFSNDLSEVKWVKEYDYLDDFIYEQLVAGDVYNDTTFLVTCRDLSDPLILFMNVETGEVQQEMEIMESSLEFPYDMTVIDDTAFVYFPFDYLITPVNLVNQTVGAVVEVEEKSLHFTVHPNGKFAVVGAWTTAATYGDATIAQYDIYDDKDWYEEVGDLATTIERTGRAIAEGEEGSMYLANWYQEGALAEDIEVLKVDETGNVLWEIILGLPEVRDHVYGIAAAADGGCVVSYLSRINVNENSVVLQKISANGELEWSQTLIHDYNFAFKLHNIITASDGGFYFGTSSQDSLNHELLYLTKIEENGTIIWTEEFTLEDRDLFFYNLKEANNGDILLAGYGQKSFAYKPILFRISAEGELIWGNEYQIPANTGELSNFSSMTEDENGVIYAVGLRTYFSVYSGQGHFYKIAADGEIIEGGIVEDNQNGTTIWDIVRLADGRIFTVDVLTDQIADNVFSTSRRLRSTLIQEYDEDLNIVNEQIFGIGEDPFVRRMIAHSNGGLVAYGRAEMDGNKQGYLLYIDSSGVSNTYHIVRNGALKLAPTTVEQTLTVNFSSSLTGKMSVTVVNALGQSITHFETQKIGQEWQKEIQLTDRAQGNYFLIVEMKGQRWVKQFFKK